MAIARLGDPSLPTFVAAGSLRWNQTKESHELPCAGESAEIPDLTDEGQGGQGLDPFEGAQDLHRLPIVLLLADLFHHRADLLTFAFQLQQVSQIHIKGLVVDLTIELQPTQPLFVPDRPVAARRITDSAAKEKVQHPLLGLTKIAAQSSYNRR